MITLSGCTNLKKIFFLDILPACPIEVEASELTDQSITIQWTLPANSQANPDKFTLNITKARYGVDIFDIIFLFTPG